MSRWVDFIFPQSLRCAVNRENIFLLAVKFTSDLFYVSMPDCSLPSCRPQPFWICAHNALKWTQRLMELADWHINVWSRNRKTKSTTVDGKRRKLKPHKLPILIGGLAASAHFVTYRFPFVWRLLIHAVLNVRNDICGSRWNNDGEASGAVNF